LLARVHAGHFPIKVVHHNDADGIAAAAVLSHAFGKLGLEHRLLPLEKIHEMIIQKIHTAAEDLIIYVDLGGQSSDLISRYSRNSRHVIILDHHLPGGPVSGNVIHLNPEFYGLSGDDDAAAASVCALFAGELLKEASLASTAEEAWLGALGLVGACGDSQDHQGELSGINKMCLEAALRGGEIEKSGNGYAIPRIESMAMGEVIEILNLLGSVGLYSGCAEMAVNFLLGKSSAGILERSEQLREMKTSRFTKEVERIRARGLEQSDHFEWVDVRDRFAPMGVKTIGLFLEYLIAENLVSKDKYLTGCQYLPREIPGIGTLETSLTKISGRVPPELRRSIQEEHLPDFMTLFPEATLLVEGTADGCHRFAAASLVQRGREASFMEALEKARSKASGVSLPDTFF